MKRYIISFLLVLLCVVCLVAFSPSVYAVQYETPGTVVLYVGWPSYEKVYSFDIDEGYTWQDLASDCASLGTEECAVMTLQETVFLRLPDYAGSLKIMTSEGVLQTPEDVITSASYVAGDLVEFTLEGYANGEPTGFSYDFSFIGADYTFADLAKQNVYISSSDFGTCRFYMLSKTEIVLRVGIGADGTFAYQFALAYLDSGTLVTPGAAFESASYRGLDVCQAFGRHFYVALPWISEPTCEQSGSRWQECRYCQHKELFVYEALGHDLDDDGYCRRLDCNYRDPWSAVEDAGQWIAGKVGSLWDSIWNSEIVQTPVQGIEDAIDGAIDWLTDKGNAFLSFVAVVSGASVIVVFFFIVKRAVKKLNK